MNLAEGAVPHYVLEVLDTLSQTGYEAFLVGGCVRDLLLDRPVHDYDIATNALPEQIQSLFSRTAATGLKHGTVTVLKEGHPVEVTTYRTESSYSDSRHPDAVTFVQDIQLDLARRDFTINAMAMRPNGEIIDPFGGRADLRAKCVRAVGDPVQRFLEDALRILRGLRFCAELGFQLDDSTLAGMKKHATRLKLVSIERIGQEFAKVALANWWHVAQELAQGPWLCVLSQPWPQLRSGFVQLASWSPLQSSRSGDCRSNGESSLRGERLSNRPVFEGHAVFGSQKEPLRERIWAASAAVWCIAANLEAQAGRSLARAVAWPKRIGTSIEKMVSLAQQDPINWNPKTWRRELYLEDASTVETTCAVLDWLEEVTAKHRGKTQALSIHGFVAGQPGQGRKPTIGRQTANPRSQAFLYYRELQPLFHLRDLAVSGQEVRQLGAHGAAIGRILDRLALAVLDDEVANQRDALLALARLYRKEEENVADSQTAPSTSLDTEQIRNQIVEAFLRAKGAVVSGSALSDTLGITRTAVWKHIRSLEELGFGFESVHRLGYRLTRTPDVVLEPLLKPFLKVESQIGQVVHWVENTVSTNAVAASLAQKGAFHGTVFAAGRQEGGRGRRGRSWFSPQGGLWMSTVLKKPFPLRRAAELTLLASVAVRRAIVRQTELPIRIKWPNDILCQGKKICGILAEIRADGENVEYAVLGVGMNTNIPLQDFPDDLKEKATSLFGESGKPISNLQLAGDFLTEFEGLYEDLLAGEGFAAVSDEWRAASSTLGTKVRVQTGQTVIEGVAEQIDDTGTLYLRTPDNALKAIQSGEVLF
ncbi:biotin--[acetyl-CoA-carboxylase] ligase [Alicyclobacillus tolerans]|uniref:biotin--[acetyl-CoA-carboxylase] ligase n=1 Tax=Alicyclobacillus tolerans TaxID=90970 RepID=UPI001F017FDE|nr:biotin--[acetyl-CoA-carboxylase] ligase [Alicyclobacillus tolerans]MCF8563784.1 biotin--[acetyl-CoA-carboxylase] ligase [Alicyclobacillus tolerans]